MNQNEYLKELKSCLSPLDKAETSRVVEYYSELINDKIESGMSEKEVLAQLGTPRELADKILSETQEYDSKPQHIEETESLNIGKIIGFTILLPFTIIALAVLYILAISFAISAISMQLGGLFSLVASFIVVFTSIETGIFQIGISIFVAGLGVFVGFGAWKFILLCTKITVKIFKAYARTYTKGASK